MAKLKVLVLIPKLKYVINSHYLKDNANNSRMLIWKLHKRSSCMIKHNYLLMNKITRKNSVFLQM